MMVSQWLARRGSLRWRIGKKKRKTAATKAKNNTNDPKCTQQQCRALLETETTKKKEKSLKTIRNTSRRIQKTQQSIIKRNKRNIQNKKIHTAERGCDTISFPYAPLSPLHPLHPWTRPRSTQQQHRRRRTAFAAPRWAPPGRLAVGRSPSAPPRRRARHHAPAPRWWPRRPARCRSRSRCRGPKNNNNTCIYNHTNGQYQPGFRVK